MRPLFFAATIAIAIVLVLLYLPNMRTAGAMRASVFEPSSFDNYDIRNDPSEAVREKLERLRGPLELSTSQRTAADGLNIENDLTLGEPEVISAADGGPLARTTKGVLRAETLKGFVLANRSVFGIADPSSLILKADETNPDGNLAFVRFTQELNGVEVFGSEVKAAFSRRGEMFRVVNSLAPGLNGSAAGEYLETATMATVHAARYVGTSLNIEMQGMSDAAGRTRFELGSGNELVAERRYFPLGNGVVRPAWLVLIETELSMHYVVVDAHDGSLLWRKNLVEHQTLPATYNVYGNLLSPLRTADSPSPFSPGCNSPIGCTQPPAVPRMNFSLVGNEPPYTFNNLGWIPDTGLPVRTPADPNITDGNNVETGIDRDATNGVDPNGWAFGNPFRVFDRMYNPGPGLPPPGEEPRPQTQSYPPTDYQQGAAAHGFYTANRWHDEMYRFGFTEQAGNFQHFNFGRGGSEGDRISYEIQDISATNGANFATPADGNRPRMQMFVWTGPTPDRDGALDSHIPVHEMTHGLSNRLIGNAIGLGSNMSRGLGEGWSDFYAFSLLAEPGDDRLGTHALAGYVTHLIVAGFEANYYYGIRRFPVAVMASIGPNGRPHNPLTFRYINSDCNQLIGTTTSNPPPSSAFPRGPIGTSTCDQTHNMGEVWAVILWEVRDQLIQRHGAVEGNRRAIQYVTDGMKISPLNPTFLQARDAILAAAQASDAMDLTPVWRGFAIRGLGFSASIQNVGTGANNTSVTEAFNVADLFANSANVTSGDNLLEPGECNTLAVPIINNSGNAATNVSAVLSTTTPGVTVARPTSLYPNIAAGSTAVNTTPFVVSIDNSVSCFTLANFTLTVTFSGGAGGGSPATFNFSLPVGSPGNSYSFTSSSGTIPPGGLFVAGSAADDAAITIPLPAGWASSIYNIPITSLSANTNGSLTINNTAGTVFNNTALPANVGGLNPTLFPLWDDLDMDAADVTNGGIFTNTLGTAPDRQLVIEWRAQHFNETVNGPITVNFAIVLFEGSNNIRYIYALTGVAPNQDGVSATVGIQRQNTGTQFTQHSFNQAVITPGLRLDGVLAAGHCTPETTGVCIARRSARADFDGDGRSDVSIFRPSDRTWYINRSTAGFSAVNWGLASDVLVPNDFDGDGKADLAIFRRSENSAWYILNSSTNSIRIDFWGASNIEQPILFDKAVPADYDGDGKADLAVWRTTDNLSEPARFLIKQSSNNSARVVQWGSSGDIPAPTDYDGDSKTDLAIYRGGVWWILNSTSNSWTVSQWGLATDKLVPADYDGDGRDDIAVYRPSEGIWYVANSSGGLRFIRWGIASDIPVPADYDGDGRADLAVYRDGIWYILGSTSGVIISSFGLAGDVPLPGTVNP